MTQPTVIAHFDLDGEISFFVNGARLIIIDDRAPDDRAYEWSTETPANEIEAMLGDVALGSKSDVRHPALANKVEAALDGRPMLSIVKGDTQ